MLTKELFSVDAPTFGLVSGQMLPSSKQMFHNSGWYNQFGDKIGWGDLSLENLEQVSRELDENDMFIVLRESDSFWPFVTKIGPIGAMSETSADEQNPGVEYIAAHACVVVRKDVVWGVEPYFTDMSQVVRETLLDMMKSAIDDHESQED